MSEAEAPVLLTDLVEALPELLLSFIDNVRNVRLWCKAARQAVDKQRRRLIVRDAYEPRPLGYLKGHRSCESLLRSSRGILDRGCRPHTVELHLRLGSLEERRHCGSLLLQAFAGYGCGQHSGSFHGPSVLVLTAVLLNPTLASGIASVFPALEVLQLNDVDGAWADSPDCLEGLNLLLGSTAGQRGAGPLMPQLASVRLPYSDSPVLGAACVFAAAAQCGGEPTLRELEATLELEQPGVAECLAGLTQLQALKLTVWCDWEEVQQLPLLPLLPSVLAPLVGLTRLSLSAYNMRYELPGAVLAGMTGLQQLEACGLSLGMGGLEALRSLTSLTVGALLPPPGGAWEELLATPAALWPLPPRLRSLMLCCGGQPIELLAALQRTSGIAFTCGSAGKFSDDCCSTLEVIWGRHTTRSGVLLAVGEAALCGAIRLLMAASESVRVVMSAAAAGGAAGDRDPMYLDGNEGNRVLLQPAVGMDGRAAGPHHGVWLEALASTASLKVLRLKGIQLSKQDLETIARCAPGLQVLALVHPTDFPPRALPHLVAGLPELQELRLGPAPLVAAPGDDAVCALLSVLGNLCLDGDVVVEGGLEVNENSIERLTVRLRRAGADRRRLKWRI